MKLPVLLAALAALVVVPSALAQDHGMDHGTGDHAMHANMPPMRGNDGPRASPNAGAMQTIGTTMVMVHYSRPSVNDREIFGGLVPYDEVWRTGANESTAISFSGDVEIGGQALAAGTYGLFTIPGEDEWTVIFNRTAEQWGAMSYDAAQDALRATATPMTAASPQEQFQISFQDVTDESATMVLAWDDVRVPVAISVAD